mmetsp:Transcript_6319/g.23136  ORF Transcript_6319/g.23136 Transcript_6319/m.23136 type:complete len:202 (-) Transcript_6319:310-915(-)
MSCWITLSASFVTWTRSNPSAGTSDGCTARSILDSRSEYSGSIASHDPTGRICIPPALSSVNLGWSLMSAPHACEHPARPARMQSPGLPAESTAMCGMAKNTYRSFPVCHSVGECDMPAPRPVRPAAVNPARPSTSMAYPNISWMPFFSGAVISSRQKFVCAIVLSPVNPNCASLFSTRKSQSSMPMLPRKWCCTFAVRLS